MKIQFTLSKLYAVLQLTTSFAASASSSSLFHDSLPDDGPHNIVGGTVVSVTQHIQTIYKWKANLSSFLQIITIHNIHSYIHLLHRQLPAVTPTPSPYGKAINSAAARSSPPTPSSPPPTAWAAAPSTSSSIVTTSPKPPRDSPFPVNKRSSIPTTIPTPWRMITPWCF